MHTIKCGEFGPESFKDLEYLQKIVDLLADTAD